MLKLVGSWLISYSSESESVNLPHAHHCQEESGKLGTRYSDVQFFFFFFNKTRYDIIHPQHLSDKKQDKTQICKVDRAHIQPNCKPTDRRTIHVPSAPLTTSRRTEFTSLRDRWHAFWMRQWGPAYVSSHGA